MLSRFVNKLGVLLLATMLFSCFSFMDLTNSASANPEKGRINGKLQFIIHVPKEELDKIPADKKERMKQEPKNGTVVDLPDGSRNIVLYPPNFEVFVDGKSVKTDKEGNFPINSSKNSVELEIKFGKTVIEKQKFDLSKEGRQVVFTVEKDIRKIMENMSNTEVSKGEIGVQARIPCLDDNGGSRCTAFIDSDCYYALIWFTKLECWQEAMDDTEANLWCNGTRNCSPSMGHSQYRHCH